MKKKIACIPFYAWAVMIAVSVALYLYPQADIGITSLFYTPGAGFLQHGARWERLFYKSVPVVLTVTYVGALLLWLYNKKTGRRVWGFTGKKLIYLLLVGAVGSGLFVNAVLKDHWGRARPVQIVAFGGDRRFTPPFVISDAGGKSFSSGHTSGAFALLALIFLVRRYRKTAAAAVVAYGLAVSLARIAAGGHFFSDVVVSIMVMYITAAVLYRWMFGCTDATKESNGM